MMPLAMELHCIFLLLTARPVFALSSYAPADPTQTDADLFAPRPAQQKTVNRSAIHIIYVSSLN
jgi:hypothetical protein